MRPVSEAPEGAFEPEPDLDALVLTKDAPGRVVLLLGGDVDKASMKVRIRRDEFIGTISLALHAGGTETLDFLTWDGSTMVLGARRDARDEELASEPATGDSGWHEMELVVAGTHFRGYLDGSWWFMDTPTQRPSDRLPSCSTAPARSDSTTFASFPSTNNRSAVSELSDRHPSQETR